MTVRAVEWKKPYTWGTAITIDENKVISLNLRDENNLIIYDSWDDEIYVDLQLPDEITPTDAFPVWVTTGRVIVDNGWDANGTIICAKTTSGDNIKILYEDNWTLWIDNWTWTFKQIYFKSDVDGIITTLTTYINWELAKKQNWVTSDTAPSNPSEWDLWYDTVNDALKVYDGTNWVATGTGWSWDVVVSTDTGNELSTGVGLWLGTETDFSSISTPDTNTLYIQYKVETWPRLPVAYQEVEYIQSSWSQYINTWYNPTTDTEFEITYEATNLVYTYNTPFGCRLDYNADAYYIWFKSWWSYWCFWSNRADPSTISFGTWTKRTISLKNWVLSDWSDSVSTSVNSTPYWNIYIFCGNRNGAASEYSAIKLYSFKLTTSWTDVRDFVPCYRKADSVIWLYDLVNDQFYTNDGSWTFTKWNDVS